MIDRIDRLISPVKSTLIIIYRIRINLYYNPLLYNFYNISKFIIIYNNYLIINY